MNGLLRVAAATVRPRSPSGRGYALPAFAVLLIALFFSRLGHRDLYSSHEARAAQNAQRMLDTGEWAIPTLFDGQIDLQKPPGYYWLVAAAGWLNGGTVTEFETRLPAALAGLITVLMVFAFLRSEGRPTAAWIAAGALATAIHFTGISRTARIDVPLTCAITAGLLLLYRRSWLAALPITAGILLKGPIAVALIGPVALYLFLGSHKPTDRRRSALPVALILGVAFALPWFVWADHVTQGEFYRVFIVHHHVERFAGTSPALASHPWWYYIPRFAIDFLPWTPAFVLLAVWLYRTRGDRPATNTSPPALRGRGRRADASSISTAGEQALERLPETPPHPESNPLHAASTPTSPPQSQGRGEDLSPIVRRDPHLRFGMVWFVAMFVLLSTAHFKRADYLLPLYPGAAIAFGCAAEAWLASRLPRTGRIARLALQAMLGLTLVGWQVMSFVVEPREQAKEEKRRFAAMIRELAPPPNEVLLFRTEPHLLAWHLGRPIASRVEWHDLRAFCDPPGTHFVVMPPEYVSFAQHIVTERKLVEVSRLEEYTADKPPRPLVLLRTE
ncbi:MAG: glycosyltransferase family 39 protein [Gemmataceae bacterium]